MWLVVTWLDFLPNKWDLHSDSLSLVLASIVLMHFYAACSFAVTLKNINTPVNWDGEAKASQQLEEVE